MCTYTVLREVSYYLASVSHLHRLKVVENLVPVGGSICHVTIKRLIEHFLVDGRSNSMNTKIDGAKLICSFFKRKEV